MMGGILAWPEASVKPAFSDQRTETPLSSFLVLPGKTELEKTFAEFVKRRQPQSTIAAAFPKTTG
jgi:hypothetical protein